MSKKIIIYYKCGTSKSHGTGAQAQGRILPPYMIPGPIIHYNAYLNDSPYSSHFTFSPLK